MFGEYAGAGGGMNATATHDNADASSKGHAHAWTKEEVLSICKTLDGRLPAAVLSVEQIQRYTSRAQNGLRFNAGTFSHGVASLTFSHSLQANEDEAAYEAARRVQQANEAKIEKENAVAAARAEGQKKTDREHEARTSAEAVAAAAIAARTVKPGLYYLQVKFSNLQLHCQGRADNSDIVQGPHDELQRWEIEASETPGYFYLRNKATGLYLDVNGGKKECGGRICGAMNRDPKQVWKFSCAEEGYFYVQTNITNYYLDVKGGLTDPGTLVCQCSRPDPGKQVWKLIPAAK